MWKDGRGKMWKGGKGKMWKGEKGMEEARCGRVGKGEHIKGGMRKYGVN